MKVGIVGSRGFNDYKLVVETLREIPQINLIVSGGAKGADTLGEMYAKHNDIPTMIFPPLWDKYGKSAGFIRNKDIVENSDIVIAFWDGNSKGTHSTIQLCEKMGKRCKIVSY